MMDSSQYYPQNQQQQQQPSSQNENAVFNNSQQPFDARSNNSHNQPNNTQNQQQQQPQNMQTEQSMQQTTTNPNNADNGNNDNGNSNPSLIVQPQQQNEQMQQPQQQRQQPMSMQQQYHALMKMMQTQQAAAQSNPELLQNPQFVQQFQQMQAAAKQMHYQLMQTQQRQSHDQSPQQSQSVPNDNVNFQQLNNVNFANISNEQLPNLKDYLNNSNPSPQQKSPSHPSMNNEQLRHNDDSNNNVQSLPSEAQNAPSTDVHLNLPSLSAMDYSNPQQPTPQHPQSPNAATPRSSKRGRGRPKGSKNKKRVNIDQIDQDIVQKRQQIQEETEKYNKAQQIVTSSTHWLQNNAQQHKAQLLHKYFGMLTANPVNTQQFTQEQLSVHAQKLMTEEWQKNENTLNQNIQNANAEMNSAATLIQRLNAEINGLEKNKANAIKNRPTGPIADFQAQYQQRQEQVRRQQAAYQQQQQAAYQQQQQRRQQQAAVPRSSNPWQAIMNSDLSFVPQWVQCEKCSKWRVVQVSTSEICTWQEPKHWTCASSDMGIDCSTDQQRPDKTSYNDLQLSALTIQRAMKMEKSKQQKSANQMQHQQRQQQRQHHYQQRTSGLLYNNMVNFRHRSEQEAKQHEFDQKNDDLFSSLTDLMEMKEKKLNEERFELMQKQHEAQKAAIRKKKKEKEATRQAKKKRVRKKGKDSDDEYLPDSDDTSDDEDYEDTDSELDEDEMFDRIGMKSRHRAPATFNFNALLSATWSLDEVKELVAFAAQNENQFDADKLAQHPTLSIRHNNASECQTKLEEVMDYVQRMQNPQKAASTSSKQKRRNDAVDSDDDDEDYEVGNNDKKIWSGGRKSSRIAAKRGRKKVNYNEDTLIDQYLAREEAMVKKGRKKADDVYVEKIERILKEKKVFVAPKSNEIYDDMQHAMDNGCKPSELLEQTRYFLKLDGVSYLHCEWQTESSMIHRFGKLRVQRKLQSWNRQKDEYESKCDLLWGGEAYDPAFSEVDRIIDCIEVDGNKKFNVKWAGLSYACCTWETADCLIRVDCAHKIAQFEKWNKLPSDTQRKATEDAAFKKAMYGWYKIKNDADDSEGRDQPAQNDKDAKMKKELFEQGIVPDEPLTYKGNHHLRDYQIIGLNWLIQKFYEGSNSILADEMGLGKTVQSTCFIEHLYRVNNVHGPFLIVAPLSTLFHWKREIEGWTDLNCVVYHDSDRGQLSREVIRNNEFYYSKSKRKTPKFNILLTTYEILMMDLEWLANIKWFLCIIDEGHRLKSRNTQLTKCFELLDADRRILLTGTPIQNSMDELFNLLHFLEPNEFQNMRDFNKSYGGSSNNEKGDLHNSSQLGALQDRIQHFILRRLKEHVEKSIPNKQESIIDIELTSIQKTYYRALFDRNREFLEAGVDKANVVNLINLEIQLRKCCNHPWLIDGTIDRECGAHLSHKEYMEKTIAASGKMVLLDKLLPKLKREGHRVLIFSQMRKVLSILEEYLEFKEYKYERFDGTTSSHDRQAAIDRYCAPNSDRLVFLLTTRAGGVGLNLVAADTVIIFDSDWNPQQDIQAQARCHRIGQNKTVGVYRLVTKNTYEAQMFERASRKLGLGQAILSSVEHGVKKQDVKDLKQLDNMLRHGAYAILNDDDEAAKKWQECDIDELLQHAAHRIDDKVNDKDKNESERKGIGMHSFTRKTFESEKAKETAALDVTGKNFWNDLWKIRQSKTAKDNDDDLYLDNYLLDDTMRADRLLTSLTSMKDAAIECAKAKRRESGMDVDEEDESDVNNGDEDEPLFANKKKRDKWFKRYKLHMVKMIQLKESPTDDVPSLELQLQLSNLMCSLSKHFSKRQRRDITEWNSKLNQRNRRKAKKSLNENDLSQPFFYGVTAATRSSKRKRKRNDENDGANKSMSILSMSDISENEFADNENDESFRPKTKKRKLSHKQLKKIKKNKQKNKLKKKKKSKILYTEHKGEDDENVLDELWAFDYPSYAFNWADQCEICDKKGKLILCDGPCVGSFHLKCLGLKKMPTADPWYCDKCKVLRERREQTFNLTGGKSSRFPPKTYKIRVWMDRGDDADASDVYATENVLEAVCFYPETKAKKSKRKSGRKRSRRQLEKDDGHDGNVYDTDDGEEYNPKPARKRAKRKSKTKKKVKKENNEIFAECGGRVTRSRQNKLDKIMAETTPETNQKNDEKDQETEQFMDNDVNLQQTQSTNNLQMQQLQNQQMFGGYPNQFTALNNFAANMNQNGANNLNAYNMNNVLLNSMGMHGMNAMNLNNMAMSGMNMATYRSATPTTSNNTTIINNITNIHNINNQNAMQQQQTQQQQHHFGNQHLQ